MAGFEDLMGGAETGAQDVTVTITKKADGTFLVEQETPAEEQTEQGQGGETGETQGTPVKSLDEAMQVARGLLEGTDAASEDAAFNEGFASKKGMMQ